MALKLPLSFGFGIGFLLPWCQGAIQSTLLGELAIDVQQDIIEKDFPQMEWQANVLFDDYSFLLLLDEFAPTRAFQ